MDAELADGLPQPDLVSELAALLGQLALLPVGARLRERVTSESAALVGEGAAGDTSVARRCRRRP